MKIVCNCGNEIELIENMGDIADSEEFIEENGIHCKYDYLKSGIICAEHDEVWITCAKCNYGVHIFT